MYEPLLDIGLAVKNLVLFLAGLLKLEAAPGLVTLVMLLSLAVLVTLYVATMVQRRNAVSWLLRLLKGTGDQAGFSAGIDKFGHQVDVEGIVGSRRALSAAWGKYRETLVAHNEGGRVIFRNAVRPSVFFNADDLHFSVGNWRIVPGLFVSIGLFLTFLGLISALSSMDLEADKITGALRDLLTIASAKFIMSLTGLFCSIIFTIVLRSSMSKVEEGLHLLCGELESRLTFISLEDLAVEQLAATREQREHFRMIGLELVAELGRPLREELPQAISASISAAMGPLIQQVGRMGADGLGVMIDDLSTRFSDDVGRALSKASESLVIAGDRIAELSIRMDQSSGRVGSEIDTAVASLTKAVDDLRNSLGDTAQTASGAFTQGAEHLLSVMNETLEGIRDNTGEGARAISAAAVEMKEAASGFRNEIDNAARQGGAAAKEHIDAAGASAATEIDTAVASLTKAVDDLRNMFDVSAQNTSGAFTQGAEHLLSVMNETLEGIRDNTGEGARAISAAAVEMKEAASGFRTEIDKAAKQGRAAAKEHIDAAGASAAEAIGSAGVMVLETAGRTSNEISKRSEQFVKMAGKQLIEPLEQITNQLSEIVATTTKAAGSMRRLSDGVNAGAEASEKAAVSMQKVSKDIAAAVNPIRMTNERIETAITQLKESMSDAATTVTRSSQATAQSAAQILDAAREALGGHSKLINASLGNLSELVDRMKGQGERLDVIDTKLGSAFDEYTNRVALAVDSLFGHVRKMNEELAPALDTLRTVVEQAEQFMPENRKR